MDAETTLDVRGLDAFYGMSQVLFDCWLKVNTGRITAVLGANGAGKTTLLRAVSGLVTTRGVISLAGQSIQGKATENIARLGVAHVPDGRGTFVHLTVQENLQLGAYRRRDREQIEQDFAKVQGYFPRLKERWGQQAGTLSGGEQQMLAIGRALMLRPSLLLLDEPSFGLAPLVVREIFAIMARINAEDKVSILLVEQNAELALQVAHDACLLETGRVVLSGPAQSLISDESVRRAYLGY